LARALGFSIPEIAIFAQDIGSAEEPSERWRELAQAKLPQVAAMMEQASEMKQALETGLAQ
jgi:DNA-binding transcriptional MerR regulator